MQSLARVLVLGGVILAPSLAASAAAMTRDPGPAAARAGDSTRTPPRLRLGRPIGEPLAPDERDAPPPVPREFRAAWVATVGNIDWPSRPGLSTWQQQQELIAILDRAVALHLNAIVFQVRPDADALYRSRYEPWSEYLTGVQGRAPEPYYDPLAFAIREAHARGLELHAWVNPFRARDPSASSPPARTHVSRRHPSMVRKYGENLWLDPGDPAAQAYSLKVILDIVRRYDIDGLQIDDYFYPYREYDARGSLIQFPDDATYRRYRRHGGRMARDDWRRHNIDHFVQRLYESVKAIRPKVMVGISPFGIWRPGTPAGIVGLDSYQEIFADSRKWLEHGWLDYLAPQLYWPVAQEQQSYSRLLAWWVSENAHHRHIWPGNFTSRVGDSGQGWPPAEILDQIRLTRAQDGATGNIHFSMRALMDDRLGLDDSLLAGPYARQALVPSTPWLDHTPPARPVISVRRDSATGGEVVTLTPGGKEQPWLWVVRTRVPVSDTARTARDSAADSARRDSAAGPTHADSVPHDGVPHDTATPDTAGRDTAAHDSAASASSPFAGFAPTPLASPVPPADPAPDGSAWTTAILPGAERAHWLTTSRDAAGPIEVWVTAVDRLGNESRAMAVRLPPPSATATTATSGDR